MKHTPKNLTEFSQEYLAENKQQISLVDFFKKAEEFKLKWERENTRCNVCGKKLSHEEIINTTPMEFLRCCGEHKEYGNYFSAQRVRVEILGLPEQIEIPSFYE